MEIQLHAIADDFVVIPRFALHEKEIFLVDENNQLERVKIANAQLQGELVLLRDQSLNGRQVVSSDLFPAVQGMLLAPKIDEFATAQIPGSRQLNSFSSVLQSITIAAPS